MLHKWLIGEAPGRGREDRLPFAGPCETRWAHVIGHDWRSRFHVVNLLDYWPGSGGEKGATLPALEASIAASAILRTIANSRPVSALFLCGLRVAAAFRVPRGEFFERAYARSIDGFELPTFVVPHPSGVSHWWNDPANVERARAFFAEWTA
jgi:hypothetical protein